MTLLDQPIQINDRRLSVLYIGIFAGLLGALLYASPVSTFLYAQQEYDNILAAKGFWTSLGQYGVEEPPLPFFSLNWVEIAFLKLAIHFHFTSQGWLWAGQVILSFLSILFTKKLFRLWMDSECWGMALFLLGCHPLIFYVLLWNPAQVITLLLLAASLFYWQQENTRPLSLCFSLFLLSFTGCQGLCFAVLELIYFSCISQKKDGNTVILAIFAVLPSGILFILMSLLTGCPGGASLPDSPTLFSSISVTALFSEIWTDNFRALLFWMANGCMDLPFPLWIYGLLALSGFFESWQTRSIPRNNLSYIAAVTFLWLCLFAFLPPDSTKQELCVLLISTMIFVTYGIQGLRGFEQNANLLKPILLAVFFVLTIGIFLWQIPNYFSTANYTKKLHDSINSVIAKVKIPSGEKIVIPFDPCLFAHFPDYTHFFPLNLRVDSIPVDKVTGSAGNPFNLYSMEPPFGFIFYTSYAKQKKLPPALKDADWLKGYLPFYSNNQMELLSFYQRHENAENYIADTMQEKKKLSGEPFFPNKNTSLNTIDKFNPEQIDLTDLTVGLSWTFETGYQNTRQTGMAFGIMPDLSNSAIGQGCAGPGGSGRERLLWHPGIHSIHVGWG